MLIDVNVVSQEEFDEWVKIKTGDSAPETEAGAESEQQESPQQTQLTGGESK
jgi:heme/copper-type cytochrome/quinol oxidase subunit 2